MVDDAKKYADQDKVRKELIDSKNLADNLIYQCEKTIKDSGDKIKPEEKQKVDEAIADLKKQLEGDNLDEIKN